MTVWWFVALPAARAELRPGFPIDPNGRIITNNHVAANADGITVTLNDRR